jgi:hypothetical protein
VANEQKRRRISRPLPPTDRRPFQNWTGLFSQNLGPSGALLAFRIRRIVHTINEEFCMSAKAEQVAVRLEPELREKLQLATDKDQRPLAGLIRKVLHDFTKQPPQVAA